ncbi:MAG: hypothetical protein ABL973_21310, partial [Micropepsaceae bacterium]
MISELGQGGCRAAVVVTAGFDKDPRAALLSAGRPHLLRVVGPNCLGLLSWVSGVNASFAHPMPQLGRLAFVTQSGAITTSVVDWAIGKTIGFSQKNRSGLTTAADLLAESCRACHVRFTAMPQDGRDFAGLHCARFDYSQHSAHRSPASNRAG